jgi:RNA polymerase sigma-70 factor (ECF subfamily)
MEPEVVVRAQGGDERAFATLATEISRRLNALAVGILRDRELAEDAVQQALISIWRDLPTLREPANFEAWSYRIVVRACYAEAQRRRRRWRELLGVMIVEPAAPDDISAVVDRDQVHRGFRRLSLEQRAVVVLHYYFDLPLEAVARTLDVPEGTVRSRFHRAVQSLRAALEADARSPVAAGTGPSLPGAPSTLSEVGE